MTATEEYAVTINEALEIAESTAFTDMFGLRWYPALWHRKGTHMYSCKRKEWNNENHE